MIVTMCVFQPHGMKSVKQNVKKRKSTFLLTYKRKWTQNPDFLQEIGKKVLLIFFVNFC